MPNKIKVKFNPSKAQKKIKELADGGGNMQPVYETIGRTIVNRIRLCFKLGVDPWSQPWMKLKYRQGQPLRDSGRLQRSIVSQADATGVTIGTNIAYARVHQNGADIKAKNKPYLVFPGPGGKLVFAKQVHVPARRFMPLRPGSTAVALPPAWSVAVVKALRTYFIKRLQEVD